jgi:hypothetical protein
MERGTLLGRLNWQIGKIVRCPSCDNVLIRIVHARGRYFLDMRGVRVLEIKEG